MRVLMSTMQSLLHVDLDTREVCILEDTRTEYYGISWFPGDSSLVLSHSGVDNATLRDLTSYANSELGWISFQGGETSTFLSQPHQIQCCSDGRIVCTNTGRNRIVVIDPKAPGHFQEAGISQGRWDRLGLQGPYGDHLNSVFEHQGKLYAVAHGHSMGSSIAVFSYPELRLLSVDPVASRTGLHNIFVTDDGQMFSCHSEAGALIEVNSGTVLWEAGTPVYTRGMAVTEDYMLIGESARIGRDQRRSSLSGLWVIDRRTWKAIDYFALGPFGAVHDVRIIDAIDLAHHGVPLAQPENLLRQTALDVARERKLASAELAVETRSRWLSFELAFGSPETDAGGWKNADENLCLAIRRQSIDDVSWEFEYRLDQAGHVSVVFDYQGIGGDTGMVAYLLQGAGDGAELTLWREAGGGWEALDRISTMRLPLRGRFRVNQADREIALSIDDVEVHRGRLQSPVIPGEKSGIRWQRSGVRPMKDERREIPQ